jgi:phospholipid/cholesterol/gamma-HCH transport system substrate-binding protein
VQLAAQRKTIGAAVEALDPGLATLADQRAQLTGALTALGKLSGVGKRVIERSRDDALADLRALQPLLDQLVKAGDDLPKALDFMLSFPFPPNITGAIVGSQVNLQVTLDLDVTSVLANLVTAPGTKPTVPGLPLPTLPPLPLPPLPLPTLPVPTLPGLPLPTLPGLPLGAGQTPGANGTAPLALAAEPGVWPPAGFTPIVGEAAGVRGDLYMILIGGLR